MAVITVAIADSVPVKKAWELPPDPDLLRSPIPSGLLKFNGQAAVALKGTSDETTVNLALTMPPGFVYLVKTAEISYESDDLTNDFNNNGYGFYFGEQFTSGQTALFGIQSIGELINNATSAVRIWTPIPGVPKLLLNGGDTFNMRIVDMSADASTAGDAQYYCEFYIYNVDQVDKFEVHTPIPTINQGTF